MEELSATFSPHLSESDRASVYNQITENTNNLRKLDSEVQKKKDHLNSDIEEVFVDNTCFLNMTRKFKRHPIPLVYTTVRYNFKQCMIWKIPFFSSLE